MSSFRVEHDVKVSEPEEALLFRAARAAQPAVDWRAAVPGVAHQAAVAEVAYVPAVYDTTDPAAPVLMSLAVPFQAARAEVVAVIAVAEVLGVRAVSFRAERKADILEDDQRWDKNGEPDSSFAVSVLGANRYGYLREWDIGGRERYGSIPYLLKSFTAKFPHEDKADDEIYTHDFCEYLQSVAGHIVEFEGAFGGTLSQYLQNPRFDPVLEDGKMYRPLKDGTKGNSWSPFVAGPLSIAALAERKIVIRAFIKDLLRELLQPNSTWAAIHRDSIEKDGQKIMLVLQ